MSIAIAAGHEATVQAAYDILRAGGNAADAAMAAFFASWAAEPCMSSAGGGAFIYYYSAERGRAWLVDGFCQTPQVKRPEGELDFFPIQVDFGDTHETFQVGLGAMAVPGAVAGIFELHRHFGSLPVRELAQPAIALAKEGVRVNAFQRHLFGLLAPILRLREQGQRLFFREGELIGLEQPLPLPQLADFLEYLAAEGPAAFYRSEVAAKIAADCQAQGGQLGRADFEAYRAELREPLAIPFRGKTVLLNPPPSIGGTALAYLLAAMPQAGILPPPRSEQHALQWLKAQRQAWKLRDEPAKLRLALEVQLATRLGSTTHLSILDRQGNAVALTATNGEGCGYFAAHTDIQLNNMLGEAALLPRGFHSWAPNQRLSSMMSPTLLFDEEKRLQGALGSSGAGRIATAISQVLYLLVGHGLPLEEAIAAPRTHFDGECFHLEPGISRLPESRLQGTPVKYWEQPSLFFGGLNAVFRYGNAWQAVGDRRRDGVGVLR
jgi:gamma-glutamyltranspeptidase / glutathione hydrolase